MHLSDVVMSAMASRITDVSSVKLTVCSDADQRKHPRHWREFTDEFPSQRASKGAVTCAVCPESAWLVTFLIGNVSTGVVTWSALRCGASGESGKKVAAAPLSKTAAAAAAAKT